MDVTIAAQPTVLYPWHIANCPKNRFAAFAGYLMPLWYSSIANEHKAVRQTAGLFDCTHMGILDVAGDDAEKFLNRISTNDVSRLSNGQAQYSYILDEAGNVLDDIILYRRKADRFLVIVNAANKLKIDSYITAMQNMSTMSDQHDVVVHLVDNANAGKDARVDIALQGPASLDIISDLLTNAADKAELANLKSFHFLEINFSGLDVIIARTGYTGAKMGFELFVHPDKTPALWNLILEKGKRFGIETCGLGARDSLRIEAGLPLYGHELDGEYEISPFEAGYRWAVKLEKDFFLGKAAMQRRDDSYDMEIIRIELPGQKGVRPVRQNDGILDDTGRCVGWVTSCAGIEQNQIALAYVIRGVLKEGQDVKIYYLARTKDQAQQGRKERINKMEVLSADLTGKVFPRFAKF